MTTPDPQLEQPPLPRVPTRVPGLDAIVGGGLLQAGVYILQGAPGAGKTILANQIAHLCAVEGGRVVYVTMLAESHARLLQHLRGFSYFDPAAVPDKVFYVSAFDALRNRGLPGVVDLLRKEMRARSADLLVLDGLVMAASAAESDQALKLFVSDIQAHAALTGCTTLLLTSDDADRPVSAEQTMVDGIVLLREKAYGPRRERQLEVVKFRGSATLRGAHAFEIGPDGIQLYPRLEALQGRPSSDGIEPVGVSTGVEGLDRMFDIGGFAKGSVTTVLGAPGAGKTTLALQYLAASGPGAKGLFFGFYESPLFLRKIARQLGLDRAGVLDSDAVEFIWHPYGENMLDRLAAQLLRRARELPATRVVIDGLGALVATPTFQERGAPFVAALMNGLRECGATTLVAVEELLPDRRPVLDAASMSSIADAAVRLTVSTEREVRRLAHISKCRISTVDLRVRELVLGAQGLEVAPASPPDAA